MEDLNYNKIYKYRFSNVNVEKKKAVWKQIALWIYELVGRPQRVLEPACGSMEFLKSLPSQVEAWGVDMRLDEDVVLPSNVHFRQGSLFSVDLPTDYFDAVWISNFLEHLKSPEEIHTILKKMYASLKEGGQIVIMGPNFKYCSQEYFDFADHRIILTEKSVKEFLYSAGFEQIRAWPRFLPFSFTGILPPSPFLTKIYLRVPFLWSILGKQFLLVAKKAKI